jgi:hypothetical protein
MSVFIAPMLRPGYIENDQLAPPSISCLNRPIDMGMP